jgi:hypothetical protein
MRFREQLEEIYDVMKDKPVSEILTYIMEKHKEIKLAKATLQGYIYQIRNEHTEVMEVVDEQDWSVIDDTYVFAVGEEKKKFSVELIDNIFLHYSTRGHNYTQLQIIQRFGLKAKTFSQIQRKFKLSKACDVISPYTKEHNTHEEVLEIIDSKLEKVLESGELTTRKYQEKLARKHRKNLEENKLDKGWQDSVILEILEQHPLVSEIKISRDDNNEVDEITVVLADIHAGGKNAKSKLSDRWDMEMVAEKLQRVAQVANSYKAAKVNLVILGDLVETVSGVNHPDSWKGIEAGMFGPNIITKTYEFLVDNLINKVTNLNKIIATGGNHDRLQASNKLGDTGATDLIFYMIKQRLELTGSTVEVIYDPVLVSYATKKFGIIGVHGDKGLHKRELSYVTQKFAKNRDQYQFVFSAHLHSFFCKTNDDQEFGRRITIPAIITGNDYSDVEIGRASKSGCVVVKENIFGEPDMIIHNL